MRTQQTAYSVDGLGDSSRGAVATRPVSRGQSLVEYALIIVLVAIAVAVALSLLAPTINSIFRAIPPAL
ncbi:MAG TPA: hypothetical protein VF812_14635 [Ktedonobacterales bacterium]